MTYKTHLIGGATAGLIVANSIETSMIGAAVVMGTAMLGSVLPDIDYQGSKLAKSDAIIGIASSAICSFTKHRGFTHTVPGAVAFTILVYALMMFNSAQQALIALLSAFSGFIVLQVFGHLRRYSVLLALAAYMIMPRLIPYLQGRAAPIAFSPETSKLAAIGVFAGCISHMAYDTFNRRGIMWLWPLSKKSLHLMSIKTRSVREGIFAAVMLVAFAFVSVHYYKDAHVVDFVRGIWRELSAFAVKN